MNTDVIFAVKHTRITALNAVDSRTLYYILPM